jgi:hypothetical protein
MLAQRVLYYGQDRPLPQVVPLRAGPLSLRLEDGDLRYIKYGDREIIRRIYVAIRDRNWGTVPNVISEFSAEIHDDSFRITFEVTNRQGEIDFSWRGSLTGSADGVIEAIMDGVAHADFMKNRIGFCVLYPSELAGAAARVTHSGGATEEACLPEDVCPNQPVLPFGDMNGLAHGVQPGLWADVRFAGDIFEMEDQRNWTDASFKIFCTPLSQPYPKLIKAGEQIVQSVTLRLVRDTNATIQPAEVAATESHLSLTINRAAGERALPEIGLGVASHDQPLTAVEVERLKKLHIGHLRADLQLSGPDYTSRLQRAVADAEILNVPLHLALMISVEDGEAQLAALADLVKKRLPNVAAWLIYPAREIFWGESPVREVLELAHGALDGLIPGARFGSGTNADYIFMARSLPPLEMVDFLTFAITPQVHAFDNASVVETARAQAAVAHSAQRLSGGRPVIVSPITLKMRYNAYASEPPKPTPPGVLPSAVDPRQMSLFGAGWTVCSIGTLAATGVEAVTYFETTGWRGVMETASGSSLPAKFQSFPGGVYPMYHIFADLAEFAGGEVLAVRASNPLAVDGLALGKGGRLRVLVANMTDTTQDVAVGGMPEQVSIRILDESNAERAMQAPEAFRSQPGRVASSFSGTLELALPPHAVARLDA